MSNLEKYKDETLLKRLQEDMESGITLIMEQYVGILWSVCSHRLENPEDVKECVNDVFAEFCLVITNIDVGTLRTGPVEFRYSIFRHRWDYTEITKSYDHYTTVEERDSQEQLRYDRERKIDELSALGSTAENYVASSGYEMVAKDKYLKEKAKHREAIGREKYLKEHDDVFEKEKHFSGDEIATVLVYSPSDKLIGVYCADSIDAVAFTLGEVEKKMNFKLSPMVTAFGESQRGMLYMRYLN